MSLSETCVVSRVTASRTLLARTSVRTRKSMSACVWPERCKKVWYAFLDGNDWSRVCLNCFATSAGVVVMLRSAASPLIQRADTRNAVAWSLSWLYVVDPGLGSLGEVFDEGDC